MLRKHFLAGLALTLVASASAQVPTADLAKPPASATHYIVQSTGGKHGESWRWTSTDGTRMARESINLRGQVFELDSSGKAGADGMPASIVIRGVTPQGNAGETFAIAAGKATNTLKCNGTASPAIMTTTARHRARCSSVAS